MKFWIFTFYKYSIFKNGKQKSYYRFFNYKNQKSVYIKKSTKTVIYHDADELLKKYGNKWQIPTNKDWVFLRNNKVIEFKDI